MKVNEFVEKFKKNKMLDIKKELEVKEYIGIVAKEELARVVLDNCTTETNNEIHINSLERYLLFIISVISMHTNLDFSDEDNEDYSALDDYDSLCENGLIDKIIGTFKEDYDACEIVLNMMTTDRLQSGMTIEKKIYSFLDNVSEMFQHATDSLLDIVKINTNGETGIDTDKLLDIYNEIVKKEE